MNSIQWSATHPTTTTYEGKKLFGSTGSFILIFLICSLNCPVN